MEVKHVNLDTAIMLSNVFALLKRISTDLPGSFLCWSYVFLRHLLVFTCVGGVHLSLCEGQQQLLPHVPKLGCKEQKWLIVICRFDLQAVSKCNKQQHIST